MRKTDRQISVGLSGALISLVLFCSLCFILEGPNTRLLPFAGGSVVFFTGYFWGGLKSGIKWMMYTALFFGSAALARHLSLWLRARGLIPPYLVIPAAFVMLAVLCYGTYKIALKMSRKFKVNEINQKPENMAENAENVEEIIQSYKENTIYLIERRLFGYGKVYKTVTKDNDLFLCRAGGRFYEIGEIALRYSVASTENELLHDKYNRKISLEEIKTVSLNHQKNTGWIPHAGWMPYNGTVLIHTKQSKRLQSKRLKFVIHPINSYDEVKKYFHTLTGLMVEEK